MHTRNSLSRRQFLGWTLRGTGLLLLGPLLEGTRYAALASSRPKEGFPLSPVERALASLRHLPLDPRAPRDFSSALRELTALIQQTPTAAYLCQRGFLYLGQRAWPKAEADFEQARRLEPDSPLAACGLGVVALRRGDYEQATYWAQQALKSDPESPRAHLLRGQIHFLRSEPAQALAAYQQALALEPTYLPAYLSLGALYYDVHRDLEAIDAYRQALELDPRQETAAYYLGRLYQRTGLVWEGLEYFAQLQQREPRAFMPALCLAQLHQAAGNLEQALAYYRQAQALRPQAAAPVAGLVEVLLEQGESEQVLAAMQPLRGQLAEVQEQRAQVVADFLRTAQTYLSRGWAPEEGEQAGQMLEQAGAALKQGLVWDAEALALRAWAQAPMGRVVRLGTESPGAGLTQIDWPADGWSVVEVTPDGQTGKRTAYEQGHPYLYFRLVPPVGRPPRAAFVSVEFFDDRGAFRLEYDSTRRETAYQGAYCRTEAVHKWPTYRWQGVLFYLPQAAFQRRQNGGADFRLCAQGTDTVVATVRVMEA
ncbi:MAG TPA: tetratricopeptide repeat protein [Armatimonadetes bacterium]|nr:tetratricopeptide repeat protein [Armatimonadota bacterium]